jgi:hypothetical protein
MGKPMPIRMESLAGKHGERSASAVALRKLAKETIRNLKTKP